MSDVPAEVVAHDLAAIQRGIANQTNAVAA